MQSIITIFREVRDPRDCNSRYELAAMLFMALAGTLCGAKSAVDIADFAAANAATLGEIVDLPHGTPSHDSFSRLFRLLDPEQLHGAMVRFTAALREALGLGPAKGVVAIDGKSLRRGYERGRSCMPPLMLSVWDAETRLSIAARRAPGGNEVGATLAVLASLSLKNCIVTADALHCHPKMAEGVRAAGAHYALGLKANHEPLYRAACEAFAKADAAGKLQSYEFTERGHDRRERRCIAVVSKPATAPAFPGLVAFARIQAERVLADGKTTNAVRYVALSKRLPLPVLLEVIRIHWSVENQLHWPLDLVFREDDARTRKDHGPENLAVLRRFALNILRAHPADRSIARKMKLAAWSREFFFELFTHMR